MVKSWALRQGFGWLVAPGEEVGSAAKNAELWVPFFGSEASQCRRSWGGMKRADGVSQLVQGPCRGSSQTVRLKVGIQFQPDVGDCWCPTVCPTEAGTGLC